MKKKILFIEPAGSEANVFDNFMSLPLLGSLYLGTILHNAGYDVKILNENILKRRLSFLELNADIICLSTLTVNANRAKDIAKNVRLFYPQTKIIIGGIHPSLLPSEFVDYADHIVIGESESIIIDLIEGKYKDKVVYGEPYKNLDELPLINYSLLENYQSMKIIPIMTSRGCPFNCNFCTVTKIFGRVYRKQSVDRIIKEIKNALQYFKTNYVFFYDDNFTADKKRIIDLLDKIIEEKINIIWTAQVRVDVATDDLLLSKMFKAGCERFYIGFESFDDNVLKAYNKMQTKKDIENAIKKIHSYGISIHGMFIFGNEFDTNETINNTIENTIKLDVDTVQFMILTPFPGTVVYDNLKKENKIFHFNWNYYDGMHIVFRPKNISPYELQIETIKAYKKFYSVKRTMLELLRFVFNITFDAFVFNFDKVYRYDINNLYLKMGAKFIIREYLKLNKEYCDYLKFLN
ncbi:MAG TPA: radical SAM protein [bacterium]|nr:radical SAM protein [bacterium]HOL47723.1 radical SAM protein [bacterium]HPQ18059.1 radical SAM protein [bacterium]